MVGFLDVDVDVDEIRVKLLEKRRIWSSFVDLVVKGLAKRSEARRCEAKEVRLKGVGCSCAVVQLCS